VRPSKKRWDERNDDLKLHSAITKNLLLVASLLAELFVFLGMEKSHEEIELRSINGDAIEVSEILFSFDAAAADCYNPEEKDKLLTLIEATFGTFEEFNAKVREVLTKCTTSEDGKSIRFNSKNFDKV